MSHLRVGARGSDLSLAQTGWAVEQIRRANPGLSTEIVVIKTHGDKDQHTPLAELGTTGGFVREIEVALLNREIDVAVHSLKDLPTEITKGLILAAMPVRAPVEDVLLTRDMVTLDGLPAGFVVGTSSPRRVHQLRRHAPQIKTVPTRGNVPTRIRHLEEGKYDGVILAAAGLGRLGIDYPRKLVLPADRFLPAPGQGSLAVQTREGDPAAAVVGRVDDAATRAAVTAERAFLRATGGGCHAALGALATVRGGEMTLVGEVFFGDRAVRDQVQGPIAKAEELGGQLAAKLVPTGDLGAR